MGKTTRRPVSVLQTLSEQRRSRRRQAKEKRLKCCITTENA